MIQDTIFTIFKKMFLVLLAILGMFLAAESGLRVIRIVRPPLASFDSELGWRLNENIVRQKKGIRKDGSQYDILYRTSSNGFQFWGDPKTEKRRLLIVGDSYTAAIQVSNEHAYYARLLEKLGDEWELFAYGCGGYGTLQEALVLKRYLPEIKPDLIIWQWCFNDLCNNSYEMDSQSSENFNITPRPFLINGTIRVLYPRSVPLVSKYSRLWHFIVPRLYRQLRARSSTQNSIDKRDINAPHFKRALQITDEILSFADQTTDDTPVLAFLAGGYGYETTFADLATRHGITFVPHVNSELDRLRKAGDVVDAHPSIGGHWCDKGHHAVAKLLYQAMREHGHSK